MRTLHAALAAERLDFLSFVIITAIAAEELPTQAHVARRLNLRYWTVRNHVDCSPWIIKHRLDRIRLSITPQARAIACRVKASISKTNPATP